MGSSVCGRWWWGVLCAQYDGTARPHNPRCAYGYRGGMASHDPGDMERELDLATLGQLARDVGLDPDRPVPPSVASFLPAFGNATALRAHHHADDPDALRWIAIGYTYWAERLLRYADAAEAANHEAVTAAAEEMLRQAGEPG